MLAFGSSITDFALTTDAQSIFEGMMGLALVEADLRTALSNDDAEAIKTKHQALMEVSMKLGEAIYKAEAEAAQGGAAGGAQAKDDGDDVLDADFEEVRDDDKKRGA